VVGNVWQAGQRGLALPGQCPGPEVAAGLEVPQPAIHDLHRTPLSFVLYSPERWSAYILRRADSLSRPGGRELL